MSAAGRARIAAAQRARWAKVKGEKFHPRNGRDAHFSPAARKRIIAAQKARWAACGENKGGKLSIRRGNRTWKPSLSSIFPRQSLSPSRVVALSNLCWISEGEEHPFYVGKRTGHAP